MTENLEKLLREVFSVDTETGYKLRYHITRALACPDYAKEIDFVPNGPLGALSGVFIWWNTSEGGMYWAHIDNLIYYSLTRILIETL